MNSLALYPLPIWITVAFLAVIFIPSFMIASLVAEGLPHHKKSFYVVLTFFALYFVYVSIACLNGWFDKVFLPPMVLLYCTFPLAIFLFTVVINLKVYQQFLANIPLHRLVQVHIFRLIGVFFLFLTFHDALPKFFSIIAGLGDIITAITSIFVAKAIQNKHQNAKKITLAWNLFGFMDILFTAITAILLTKFSIDTGSMGVDTLARFPFCFIPAFAPPVIIFLHITIFKKIKKTFS
jgi:hypothetical protein